MDHDLATILLMLDFSCAFNHVDFHILIEILSSLNVSQAVIDWFHIYLFERRQRLHIDEKLSSWQNLCTGVPQGGVYLLFYFLILIIPSPKLYFLPIISL